MTRTPPAAANAAVETRVPLAAMDPAVPAAWAAVRAEIADLDPGTLVLVACSGGPDSLALAAAAAVQGRRSGVPVGAVVVDHGLQDGSSEAAAVAAEQCRSLGLEPVLVVPVTVQRSGQGPEASARRARYDALHDAATTLGAGRVLLGHTRDDQAEQVLLGLARGSGPRSLSGMPRRRDIFARPFLDLSRAETGAVCSAYGLAPWSDPHNADPAHRRVRARALIGVFEAELGPGIVAALARSADLCREDGELLDAQAQAARAALGPAPVAVAGLAALPRPIRTRVWRVLAIEAGSPAGSLTACHVEALDTLATAWHGQGPMCLPGHIQVRRVGATVTIQAPGPVE